MSSAVKTVGVVDTGVIGASWTALFLARGLRVLVSDPAPGAKDHMAPYLKAVWPSLEQLGMHPDAASSNWTFVGERLDDHCGDVDFIQEVSSYLCWDVRSWIFIHHQSADPGVRKVPDCHVGKGGGRVRLISCKIQH